MSTESVSNVTRPNFWTEETNPEVLPRHFFPEHSHSICLASDEVGYIDPDDPTHREVGERYWLGFAKPFQPHRRKGAL